MAGRSAGVDLFNQLDTLFRVGVVGDLSDGQLLQRFLAGRDGVDQAAFTALVERHGPMVLDVCHRVLRDGHVAQDAFQATFLVLARRADSIRKAGSLASWLHGVALRIATRARLVAARRRTHERRAAALAASRDAGDGRPTESWPALHEEIVRSPRHYREAVVLCYLEGLSTEEAAARIGCPGGTVLSRLSRARERLRDRLTRRGVAPGIASCPRPAPLPGRLLGETVGTSLVFAGRRATEVGLASAASTELAKGWLRAMMLSKWTILGTVALSCALAMFGLRSFGRSDDPTGGPAPVPPAAAVEADPRPAAEAGLELSGVVRMPDGSAAAGAIVQAIESPELPPIVARTDRDGWFRLHGVFGNGARLSVLAEDGGQQITRIVDEPDVRMIAGRPIELKLAPAALHEVVVLADGRAAEGVQVVALGRAFRVQGVTGPDGKVSLRIPADDPLDEVHAWHRRLGVRGVRRLRDGPARDRTELSLLPPGPLWIRAIDPDDRPIPNLTVGPDFRAQDSDYAIVHMFEGARVRTGEDGTAIVPWSPRENLRFVDPQILDPGWKLDESDLQRTGDPVRNRMLTIRLRRLRAVKGRIAMPEGASPEGLLVTGLGCGPKTTGDIPYARVRADGTFTLRVASEHAYVLGIADSRWACDLWSGLILADDTSRPPEIRLSAYRTTPVTIRATQGERRAPVVDVRVEVGNRIPWEDRPDRSDLYTVGADRLFEPGEVRENDSVGTQRIQAPGAAAAPARPSAPLAARIESAVGNARPTGMRVLVVLRGEDAGGPITSRLVDRWLDLDRSRVIWTYLPIRVEPGELSAEAATLRRQGWSTPGAGEVTLIALDGDGMTIARETIQADPPDHALGIGDAFLERHRSPTHDALAALAAARDQARKSGRRVWIVLGGPRCGPCFRLARWIDEHRATLEKDFVFVKVMEGIDLHDNDVIKELPVADGDGVPWHAFTEPDGTILATSHGPLGNIGFPGSVEGLRHFRRMLDGAARKMSSTDVEALIESLVLEE